MKKGFIALVLSALSSLSSIAQNPGDVLFNSSLVHDINITFAQPKFWDSLMYYKQHADSFNLGTQSIMGNVTINGTLVDSIGVKLKGNSSFGYPGRKKPIKLEFNEYVSGKKYDGLKTLNLNNNVLDPTMMREKLALDFLNKKGLAAPRCTYAKVSYNGQYVGLYKLVEQIDKTFLSTHFGNNGGNLFKGDPQGSLMWAGANPSSYYNWYELHTNDSLNDWSDLVNLIDNVNNTLAASFYDTLETNLNTNSFIRQWAARNLFADLDAYFHAPHNYYLYHNTATGKFEWATWDVSVSFGFYPYWMGDSTEKVSVLESFLPLTQNMLANSVYKTTYLNAICEHLDYFQPSVLFPQIDSIGNVIRPHIYAEPDSNQMFPEVGFEYGMDTLTIHTPIGAIPGLKKFINNRRAYVLTELAALPFICTNGANDLSETGFDIQVYPNPSNGKINVQIGIPIAIGIEDVQITIYNLLGECIHQQICTTAYLRIDLSKEPDGIYFLQLKSAQGAITRKIILSK